MRPWTAILTTLGAFLALWVLEASWRRRTVLRDEPKPPKRLLRPLVGICSDCDRAVELQPGGACGTCGGRSVMVRGASSEMGRLLSGRGTVH